MKVEFVGRTALGFTKPKSIRSVLIASTLTIATGVCAVKVSGRSSAR